MLHKGDVLDGKYELLYIDDRGGMSKIWRALDTHVNKEWEIKEIDKTSKDYDDEMIRREYEIMRRLDHPSIPRIVDIIDRDDTLYIVMDKVEGENLLRILQRGIPKQETVVSWMLDVCDIITYLHSFDPPILYRDMKPSNIMLSRDQRIKLVDFGISKDYDAGSEDTQPLGTRGYAAPEQWTKETDPRSDIYAIGKTMFHLLTGKDPSKMPLTKKFPGIRDINPDLSSGLERIVTKATEEDPDDRYQSAAELANALESYKSLEQEHIEELESKEARLRKGIRTGIISIVIGGLLLASGILLTARSYSGLVSTTPGTSQAEQNYIKAIKLRPGRGEAYEMLLNEYTGDGIFTDEELQKYTAVFNENKDALSRNEEAYSNVNYEVGEALLTHYQGTGDSSSRAKILQAEPFFREVTTGERAGLAKNYVTMANFYKDYILADSTLVVKGATKENLERLLESCAEAVKQLQEGSFPGRSKMKAIIYELILAIIRTEIPDMHDAGISQSSVVSVVDLIKADPEISPENADAAGDVTKAITRGYTEKNSEEVVYIDDTEN